MFSGNTSQVSDDKLFVEDVFSTWLYTGTGAAQTITNGIDLAGKGGLVWTKSRSNAIEHNLIDTVRGGGNGLSSNTTAASTTGWGTTFSSTGFTAGAGTYNTINNYTYASWTFRKAPKFFDVVTYTGTGANRTIAHNLGVAPGCILVKRTDTTADWQVYHRSNANTEYMVLNTTAAKATGTTRWNSTTPTATEFTVGTDTTVNASGGTYVAYLFAHDATSDGVIQCGSYTGNGLADGPAVTLGWEPQWILVKHTTNTYDWYTIDNMRGMPVGGVDALLSPNATTAENSPSNALAPTATGFKVEANSAFINQSGVPYIYIAIRRGPMKTPTLGTSVFAPFASSGPVSGSGTAASPTFQSNFPVDLALTGLKAGSASNTTAMDRLRGTSPQLVTSSTAAENANASWFFDSNIGMYIGLAANADRFGWMLRRAPGFFDEVCYTGTGVARTVNHSLGVAPELMIVRARSTSGNWAVYAASVGNNRYLLLNGTNAQSVVYSGTWNSTTPTSTVFSLGTDIDVNTSAVTYVAYLFASCPGVSKVGSYTGNGSSQTINCGFAAGARFVMIKRTDSIGDWYVWDTARGIVSGNDPHLSLNTTAAEVTTDDTIDTDSSGFVVNQVAATNVNVSSATYLYMAVA